MKPSTAEQAVPKRRGRPAREAPAVDLLADVPEPTGEAVTAALEAWGGSLDQAAALLGMAGRQSMSRLKTRGTDRATLALLLLATGQHPALIVNAR